MIDSRLMVRLFEIFPESFSVVRYSDSYDYIPREFGIEKVYTGKEKVVMSETILNTAQAITKGDIERGYRYLDMFRSKKVRNRELKNFEREG